MKINRSTGEDPRHDERPVRGRAAPRRAAKAMDYDDYDEYDDEDDEDDEDERPRRRFPFGLLVVLVMLAAVAFGGMQLFKFYGELDGSGDLGEAVTVHVEQGSSLADISEALAGQGVIEYDWLFKLYTKYSGRAGSLQYGDFSLRSGMSYNDIIEELSVVQERQTQRLTFPEGLTAVAIAQRMEQAGLCTAQEFLDCANGADGSDFSQYAFWDAIPDNGRLMKCEGYLFPDTYDFFLDDTVYNYVNTFYKRFDEQISLLSTAIAAKNTTIDDVVIMATFIQEEAGVAEEDAKVSACFYNRLNSTDPLWADHRLESNACSSLKYDYENNYLWNSPTAEYYGWVENGAIPEEVLALYDTYKVSGLPAGPISNAGYAALEAAVNPDEEFIAEGYYFFVTGNPSGEYAGQYFYAKTADEHSANVAKAGW